MPARAVPFGPFECEPNNCGTLWADNNQHTFAWNTLEPGTQAAAEHGRVAVIDNQTDMTTIMVAENGNTDVVAFDQDYKDFWGICWDCADRNVIAATKCVNTSGAAANTCQRYDVRFDLSDFWGFGQPERNYNACHEFGHSIGFGHSFEGVSCLIQGRPNPAPQFLSGHDVWDHVNPRW